MTPRALLLAVLAVVPLAGCDSVARVELAPASLRFSVPGQTAKVHAAPAAKNGKPLPAEACRWSSSDPKVATVAGPANDAVVTAAGPGAAKVVCAVGGVSAEVDVLVRVVKKVEVSPARVELKLLDEATPTPLQITAVDDTGAPVLGRAAVVSCVSEAVCRGDGRGQLWPVAPGDTTAVVEVDGARSAEIAVHVVDGRSADGKPQLVKGNPMLEIEKKYLKKVAREKAEAARLRREH